MKRTTKRKLRLLKKKVIEFIKETLMLGTLFIGFPMLMFLYWLIFGYAV